MRKVVFFVLTLVWAAGVHAGVPSFTNPVLPYDYSDPDVCRVGDTYLMTSSSFNNVPGLQILASKDLVHWEIVDAAIRYRLPGYEEGDKVTGNFVWAPAIREHDGRIWIYYGDPDRGIYCVRSKPFTHSSIHPITFPLEWESPVLVIAAKGYIDPCPLWDEDGRVYLSHGVAGSRFGLKSVLLMAELSADGLSVKVPSRIIFDGHEEHPTSEGTKLYKRNGYYYLMHPAGGVPTGWQVVQRAKNIYGPYELKITLAQGNTAINGPHQGGWVDTPDGEDWFLHFQDVGVAGRIVHMQPVKWVNDWPEMGYNGEPILSYGNPKKGECTWSNFARRDEFDAPELALDWQWAGGRVKPQWYFCNAVKGILRLYSAPREAEEWMPNMLLQKIPYAAFTAIARVRFNPNKDKKMAGAESAGMIVTGKKASFKLEAPVTDEWCYLKLEMDAKQRGQYYTSTDGQNWTKVGEPFQAVEGHWIGAQVGLFCTRDNRKFNDAGWMDVDWFEILLSDMQNENRLFAEDLAKSEMKHHPELWTCDGAQKPKWEYTPTLMARTFVELYHATKDTAYLNHAQRFADLFIAEDGTILTYKKSLYNMDRIQGGNFLILLNAIHPKPEYVTAIETLREQLREQPRTSEGGFWHKQVYEHQMWLDGLFTGTTFYARYAAYKPEPEAWSDVAKQFIIVDKHTRKANGLNHHGWDESRQMAWSDSLTGCSAETWGRAEGWYVMALVDVLELMPKNQPERAELITILNRVVAALKKVQDPQTHLWYQVPDKGDQEGNYLESTCSAMYAYAMAKGVRIGVLDKAYKEQAQQVIDGLKAHKIVKHDDGTISLKDCCAVAGLGGKPFRDGTYTYYIHERICDNDPKGIAPLILACIELSKIQ